MSAADAKLYSKYRLLLILTGLIRCRGKKGKQRRDANIVYTTDHTENRNIIHILVVCGTYDTTNEAQDEARVFLFEGWVDFRKSRFCFLGCNG